MRKIVFITACAVAMLAAGCQKDSGGGASGDVSDAVKSAFEARYPGAQNVSWTVKGEYSVANFSMPVKSSGGSGENDAWFLNLNGEWEMTATNIQFEELPASVRDGFGKSAYGDSSLWTRTGKCDRLERKDVMFPTTDGTSATVYVIGVKSNAGTTVMDLYFSEEGILVNEIADAPDNGYEDQLPQKPAAGIRDYLEKNVTGKGGRVIEVDAENTGTEVEAILGNRKIELFFDAAENWVYTKTDYYRADLSNGQIGDDVLGKLRQSEFYTDDRAIDDIEYVETNEANGSKKWWQFELETRWDETDVFVMLENGAAQNATTERPKIDMGETGGVPSGGDISIFIGQKYPGARIIGRDYDDGFIEVEIFHENKEKEVRFNGKDEWVSSEWEIRVNELPAAVSGAIETGGYRIDDDEADFTETPASSYYEVEVSKDRVEYKLTISPEGEILHVERD